MASADSVGGDHLTTADYYRIASEFLSPTGYVQHNLDDVSAASCPHPPWLKIIPEYEGKATRISQE
jgi:hypothetical protein